LVFDKVYDCVFIIFLRFVLIFKSCQVLIHDIDHIHL